MKDHESFWLYDQGAANRKRLKHGLTLKRVDDAYDSPGLYVARCDCGFESSEPKSQTLVVMGEYRAHLEESA